MRIGIIALLHESNTFVPQMTTLEHFRQDLFLQGEAIRDELSGSHHEVGGFFAGIDDCRDPAVAAVPLAAFRATPAGVIAEESLDSLTRMILENVERAGRLDGILVAVHGAAVGQTHVDADGFWLSELRKAVGDRVPIIGTLDAHANLSRQIVTSCDALIAYRTNPHLDQRQRGFDAARLMIRRLRNEIRPTMAAAFPPLVINIQRQCTDDPHWQTLFQIADQQLHDPAVLSNSILLGFPYADVPEMGAATIVVTNDDESMARSLADELGTAIWNSREEMRGRLTSVGEALESCQSLTDSRICLLDMGDNVGGGSAGDGTTLVREILRRKQGPSFACLYDPTTVCECDNVGLGNPLSVSIGGKTDDQHGQPLTMQVEVVSLHHGRFAEDQPRHGGIVSFDQGRTAVVKSLAGDLTLMLTTRRVAPFSLRQLTSCGVDPRHFRILVAKGVNAPLAAYRDVCDTFIHVNTIGSTCADVMQLTYHHRRTPLFPFEEHVRWP